MPTYEITAPNGRKYRIPGPAGATDEEIRAEVLRQHPEAGGRKPKKGMGGQAWDAVKNVAAGGVEGLGYLIDAPTEALAGTMRLATRGPARLVSAGYRAVGLDDAARRVDRNARTFDRAMAEPMTVRRMAEKAVPVPKDTAGQVARFGASMFGASAIPQKFLPRIMQTPPQRPLLPSPPRGPKGVNPDIVAAGKRQNVPVRKPDANPALYNRVTTVEASRYGGPRVQNAYKNDAGLIQTRAGEVARGGNVQDEAYNLGKQIQDDAVKYIKSTGKQFGKAYDEVDRLSGGALINPQNAIKAVDDEIADLTAAGARTNSAQISYLKDLRADLTKSGGFTMKQFQGLRSQAKGRIRGDNALTASDATRRLDNVVRAFSADAEAQLPKVASALLKQTDDAYAQRMGFIDQVLQRQVIGKRNNPFSPEKAAKNVDAISRNRADFNTLDSLWGIMSPTTRADFAATTASRLGVNPGGEFQMGRFASDIAKFPANTRQTIYGQEGAQSLDDLAMLARAKSNTMGAFNAPRSSVPVMELLGQIMAPGSAGLTAGIATGNPIVGIGAGLLAEGGRAGLQRNAARGLLTPYADDIAAQGGGLLDDMTAPAIRAALLGAGQPGVRNEVAALLGQPSAARLAAEDDEEKKKRKKRKKSK